MDLVKTSAQGIGNRAKCIVVFVLLAAMPAMAQNNPYVDDKLVHFGFSLGINFMAYGVTESLAPVDIYQGPDAFSEICHVRQSSMMPGFTVGFITDLRLTQHLNLRFTPGLSFASRTLSYVTESGRPVQDAQETGSQIDVLAIPIQIPLYLKWSADREQNYRPYVIIGGGGSYNVFPDRKKPVCQKGWDVFLEAGFGCDLYFSWFKFCPEIRYQIGFLDQLMHYDERYELTDRNAFYTNSISRLRNHTISLIFNFE